MTNEELKELMEKLDKKIDEGNKISNDTLIQATKTNGRVNKLEDTVATQRKMLNFIGTSFFVFALTCIGFVFQHWLNKHQ